MFQVINEDGTGISLGGGVKIEYVILQNSDIGAGYLFGSAWLILHYLI